jgi:hypothetical protein
MILGYVIEAPIMVIEDAYNYYYYLFIIIIFYKLINFYNYYSFPKTFLKKILSIILLLLYNTRNGNIYMLVIIIHSYR